jgi:serine/threonine-protein kinase
MNHPERLGKYSIAGVLGQGAMGVVYRGFDPLIRRPVAIKTIQKTLVADDAERAGLAARFRNEAQAVGRLSHPGVVAIYEYGEDGDTAFIAMEYVDGINLERLIRNRDGLLPEAQVLSIMDQLLDALDAAHRNGVWHRDVKPGNVLISRDGQVKLTDFGIARIENLMLTQTAAVIGTPGYMAPEQYTGQGLSHKADLFAAGVLLYRMLTGQTPFAGPAQTVMYKILHEEPVPPSQVEGSHAPVFYDRLINWVLAKEPEQRIPTAAAFRQALAARGLAPERPRPAMAPPDDDTTVVRPVRVQPSSSGGGGLAGGSSGAGASAAGAGSFGAGSGSQPGTAGTDPSVLAEVERELATVMGPIAKAIVRQAARTCADVDSLRQAVAQHIPDERDRQQFMAAGTPTPKTTRSTIFGSRGTARAPAAPPPMPQAMSGAGERVNAALVDAALPVMVEIVGPIAKLIVKKAAGQGGTKAQFVQSLVDAVDAADRPRVLAALQKL